MELYRAAYRELAVTVLGSWDDEAQNARFEGKLASLQFRVIELEGRAVGAIATSEEVDHVRVHELMILPALQNRGIGSEVLRRELRSAELSQKSVRLHTALANRAQKLYVRHGFTETGRSDQLVDFEWRGRSLGLETPRLLLRPMAVEDGHRWWETIWSDDEVTRYLPSRKAVPVEVMPGFVQRMAAHWQEHGFGVWALLDKSTSELVGHCGLVRQQPGEVELVYALGRSAWGRGLATEAAQCLTAFAFEELGLTELVALVFPDNAPSAHVLEKLGFVRDGETERFGASLLRYVRRVTDARIRPEEPRDRAAVRAVNEASFETAAEAKAVSRA